MRKLIPLFILIVLFSSTAECAKLRYFHAIKGDEHILKGKTQQLVAIGEYEDDAEYSSLKDQPDWWATGEAGTVDRNGVFRARRAGTSKVIAFKDNQLASITITVTTESLHTPPLVPKGLE